MCIRDRKKTVQAGELLHPEHLKEHLADLLEWKNLMLQKIYGAKGYTMDELMAWVNTYCGAIKPYITDTGRFLRNAQKEGKSILFEAQLGALRDLDYGIYPYTTSSNTIAAFAPVGSGLPGASIDEVVGVVKAYSSCVGEGPFTCEWFGADAEKLREAGAEYGAKTGRPRRVGPIDLVATRYGVEVQGATNIALTKLDILSYMDRIPVCAHYEIDGQQTDEFPFPVLLDQAKPVTEYVPLQTNDNVITTQYPMGTIERLGLLKMDFLGLRNLTVLDDAVKMVQQREPEFALSKIPDDDAETYDMISRGQTAGVFQIESTGMTGVCVGLKPQSIEDITAVIALYRPGPMESIPRFIACKHDPKLVTYKHPRLVPILSVTYGCIVYQEQVIQIFQQLAGYSLGQADMLRRAMSKKKVKDIEREREAFLHGLSLIHISEPTRP